MEVYNSISLTGIAASLTAALGVAAPLQAEAPIDALTELVRTRTTWGQADRIFMYNPDAVAMWLYSRYTGYYLPVQGNTSLTLPLRTVMPSVTPVCFGTMYTGALPEVHGIRKYEKPVIRTDTVFDALLRAGKKPVIVSAGAKSSMSMIFMERNMDYFILPTVDEANAKALEIIEGDEYDFVALYNGDYDAHMHKVGPEGEDALGKLKKNCSVFGAMAEKIRECWKTHDTLLGFAPDHGCHEIDGGCGSHGLDMEEDLNILHFYGVIPAEK